MASSLPTMKINDSNVQSLGSNGIGKAAQVEQGSKQLRQAGSGGNSVDQVSLSDLSSAISAAQGDSPDRAAYLEELSMQVATGQYRVDAQAISQGLLDDATQAEFKE